MPTPVRAYVAESGTLLVVTADAEPPPGVTGVSGPPPVVTVNGTARKPRAAAWSVPAESYGVALWMVCYRLPVRVKPGDRVTLDLDAGAYAFAGGGTSAAAAGLPVANNAGVSRLAGVLVSGPRPIRVGWQFPVGADWSPTPIFANEAKTGREDWKFFSNGDSFGLDQGGLNPNGYPAAATSEYSKLLCLELRGPLGIHRARKPGTKHVLWDGNGRSVLYGNSNGAVAEVDGAASITGALDNYRRFTVERAASGELSYIAILNSSNGTTVSNLRVFDADDVPDPYHPPEFSPWALAQMGGLTVNRLKDAQAIDGVCSVVDWEDFATEQWASYAQTPQKYRCEVKSIDTVDSGPYTGGQRCLRLTFSRPHPYHAGQTVFVQVPGPDGRCEAKATVRYADGSTGVVFTGGTFYPQTATTGVWRGYVQGWREDGEKVLAVNDLSGSGAFACVYLNSPPPGALARFSTQCGPDSAAWVCSPHTATEACVFEMGRAFGRFYHPGNDTIPLFKEFSNECWNGAAGYPQTYFVMAMAEAAGMTPGEWYAMRAGQLFAAFRAGWVAAGRNPAQLRAVVNVPPGGRQWCADILGYSAAHGLPVDVVACSDYLEIPLTNSAIAAELDEWTLDQVLDYTHEWLARYRLTGAGRYYFDALNAIVAASPMPGVAKALYEAGPRDFVFSTNSQAVNDARTVSGFLHPRWGPGQLAHVRFYSDAGWLTYIKMGGPGVMAGVPSEGRGIKAYSALFGYHTRGGKGDGSDGEANNLDQVVGPDGMPRTPDVERVCSPVLYALRQWCRKAPPPGPHAPTLPEILAAAKDLAAAVAADEAADDAKLAEARARVKRLEADLAAARPAAG